MASLTLMGLAPRVQHTPVQAPLPDEYFERSDAGTADRIGIARAALGDRVVILGHHYQRDEIIRWADFTGDSYKLAKAGAAQTAEFIVFCGVHFMAESADILRQPHQKVILPNMTAGCSMADMADIYQVEECWGALERTLTARIIPVTYMNSAANLKAFVGEREGLVCTSSNAKRALEWAFGRGEKALFFPDQHLGRNTGYLQLGIPLEEMAVWDPWQLNGGCTPAQLQRARLLLWKGHCSVHGRFTVEQVHKARAMFPQVRVVVHPECTLDVVQAADCFGSTEYIIKVIDEAPQGSTWAIGTEINLVSRLAKRHPDKTIFCLDPVVCPCSTMYRIHPAYLLWVLDNLLDGRVVNQVIVPPEIRRWSRVALDRMLALV